MWVDLEKKEERADCFGHRANRHANLTRDKSRRNENDHFVVLQFTPLLFSPVRVSGTSDRL